MWDTGCSLPGLITVDKLRELKSKEGMMLKYEKTFDKMKEISGVAADKPCGMVGCVVFQCNHEGREFDLEFGADERMSDSGAAGKELPVRETTSGFGAQWRIRVRLDGRALAHVPFLRHKEHATRTPVVVRPHGRAVVSEIVVHEPHHRKTACFMNQICS